MHAGLAMMAKADARLMAYWMDRVGKEHGTSWSICIQQANRVQREAPYILRGGTIAPAVLSRMKGEHLPGTEKRTSQSARAHDRQGSFGKALILRRSDWPIGRAHYKVSVRADAHHRP